MTKRYCCGKRNTSAPCHDCPVSNGGRDSFQLGGGIPSSGSIFGGGRTYLSVPSNYAFGKKSNYVLSYGKSINPSGVRSNPYAFSSKSQPVSGYSRISTYNARSSYSMPSRSSCAGGNCYSGSSKSNTGTYSSVASKSSYSK